MKFLLSLRKSIVIPILVLLWMVAIIPLSIRQWSHIAARAFDDLFDRVAVWGGHNPKYFPLPRASDEELPRRRRSF